MGRLQMVAQPKPDIDTILDLQLGEIVARLRPRNLLLIGTCLEALPQDSLNSIALKVDIESKGNSARGSLVCHTGSLPFRDEEFDMVLVQHMLSNGQEPELEEACRVIRPGGQLLMIGAGRFCGARKKQDREQPSMNVGSILRNVRSRDFEIKQCEGFGMRGRPVHLDARWQKPLLRFSNLILIRGRHRGNHPMVTPLRFGRPGGASVRVPALDGLNRESAR